MPLKKIRSTSKTTNLSEEEKNELLTIAEEVLKEASSTDEKSIEEEEEEEEEEEDDDEDEILVNRDDAKSGPQHWPKVEKFNVVYRYPQSLWLLFGYHPVYS